jgi:hypothetical protein
MQPHEHPTGPPEAVPGLAGPMQPPPPAGNVPPPTGGKQPNRRLRLWLAMGIGIVVLLCLGAAGVAFSLYDGATAIKRSEPDAVADSFLRAYLVDRDDKEASLFMCKSGGDFARIAAFRTDLQSREQKYSIGIRVSWKSLTVVKDGAKATVSTDIVRAITDGSERTSDRWQLALVDEDGWRVCGADPAP